MATIDAETAVERDPNAGQAYDGFISYSHAADGLLAPRLQAALQRFAKPWWQRRALRIFRDEASLTANPHLWASITGALDDSGWFILLLSPEAAESEWVDREVEYWLGTKDPDRIVPVLTDGDFAWVDGNIISDAVPPALHGVFSDEPRWVDLRFARSEEQLDLNNASFRAAVADIASPLRSIPKEELESEEVRQHRRTIRTVWAGGLALLTLAVFAFGTAVYAVGQHDEVAAQRDIAQQNEQAALRSEEAALESEQEATAFARQVVDHANKLADGDFVRADRRNIPLPVGEPPSTARLEFLYVTCAGHALVDGELHCAPALAITHPDRPNLAYAWLAYDPFHIRNGFPNAGDEPLGSGLPPDYELQVFVTRKTGPPLDEGMYEIGTTYRFTPDYLVRESSEGCGPGYLGQTEPVPCDQFVHEFNDGLPPGSYDIWAEWWAPCAAWTVAAVCDDADRPLPLFGEKVPDFPLYHDTYTPADHFVGQEGFEGLWPFDPWESPQP